MTPIKRKVFLPEVITGNDWIFPKSFLLSDKSILSFKGDYSKFTAGDLIYLVLYHSNCSSLQHARLISVGLCQRDACTEQRTGNEKLGRNMTALHATPTIY